VQRGVDPDVLAACQYGVANPHHLWLRVSSFPLQCFTINRGLSLLRLSVKRVLSMLAFSYCKREASLLGLSVRGRYPCSAAFSSYKDIYALISVERKASQLKHSAKKRTTLQQLSVKRKTSLLWLSVKRETTLLMLSVKKDSSAAAFK
jgi:hypothetical protein